MGLRRSMAVAAVLVVAVACSSSKTAPSTAPEAASTSITNSECPEVAVLSGRANPSAVEASSTAVKVPGFDSRPPEGTRRVVPSAGSPNVAATETCVGAASTADEQIKSDQFFWLTNYDRAGAGVGPLARDGDLDAYARIHARAMAASGGIFHSDIKSLLPYGWYQIGENVGDGNYVNDLQNAYRASPAHFANLTNGVYKYGGVGVFVDPAGRIWVVDEFGI